jgi:radical SAM-linked protein
VAKVALRYGRVGRLRFGSHRVEQRAFERAVRRAGVPIAFSAGFTPHPRLSYLGAAPTGAASLAEYLVMRLAEERQPAWVAQALNQALPAELPVLDAARWDDPALGDLSGRLTHSLWRFEFPDLAPGAGPVARAARAFAALETYVARQLRPGAEAAAGPPRGAKPPRLVDLRAAVEALAPGGEPPLAGLSAGSDTPAGGIFGPAGAGCAILDVVLRHATPAARPKDIFAALASMGLDAASRYRATRLAQGQYSVEAGVLADPFPPRPVGAPSAAPGPRA